MSRKKWEMGKASIQDETWMQKRIVARFGEKRIQKARERLCAVCSRGYCTLLPLCLDGSDCPYFKQKEAGGKS